MARAMGAELSASYSGLLLASSAWAIALSLSKTILDAMVLFLVISARNSKDTSQVSAHHVVM